MTRTNELVTIPALELKEPTRSDGNTLFCERDALKNIK